MRKRKITSEIPFPGEVRGGNAKRYPFEALEVGESFAHKSEAAHQAASKASRRLAPKQFRARKMQSSYRIWRIA